MTLKQKVCRLERYWKKQGRKDMFTWVHRYLRLHSELLEDSIYKEMFDYYRNTLIAYSKKDIKDKKSDDTQLGELVDVCADIFNKNAAVRVNKYKPLVEELYSFWKENPDIICDIRV